MNLTPYFRYYMNGNSVSRCDVTVVLEYQNEADEAYGCDHDVI